MFEIYVKIDLCLVLYQNVLTFSQANGDLKKFSPVFGISTDLPVLTIIQNIFSHKKWPTLMDVKHALPSTHMLKVLSNMGQKWYQSTAFDLPISRLVFFISKSLAPLN
jgi:hypothetical protein